MNSAETAIVLTGTIVPNTTFVLHNDAGQRKNEYLKALRYYSRLAPTFFLENSDYPLLNDPDFVELKNVVVRKISPVGNLERGKGYQEFSMLDKWIASEKSLPSSFVKITGRYIYRNFDRLWAECGHVSGDGCVVIDQYIRSGLALSQLFFVSTENYRRALLGVYEQCDDSKGDWVERVIFRKLKSKNFPSRCFRNEPWLHAISGSTGEVVGDSPLKHKIKQWSRNINLTINQRYLFRR